MALADFQNALSSTDEINLGTVDRRSGREKTRPVWFVQHEDRIFLMPISGSESQWFQDVVETPTIHMTAGHTDYSTKGTPITAPDEISAIVDEFRSKYGDQDVAMSYQHPDVAIEARLR